MLLHSAAPPFPRRSLYDDGTSDKLTRRALRAPPHAVSDGPLEKAMPPGRKYTNGIINKIPTKQNKIPFTLLNACSVYPTENRRTVHSEAFEGSLCYFPADSHPFTIETITNTRRASYRPVYQNHQSIEYSIRLLLSN
eukprot:g79061.t1